MRTVYIFAWLVATAILVANLVGCSGQQSATLEESSEPPPGTETTAPGIPSITGLPAPAKLPAAADIFCDGFAYARQHQITMPRWNYRYIGPHQMGLNPQGGMADHDMAMLIFAADLAAFDHAGLLNLHWYLDHDCNDAWVGFANYADNRWDWSPVADSTPVSFSEAIHAPHGMIWFAVVVTGTEEWILDHVWFGDTALPVINSVTPTNGREGDVVTLETTMRPGSGPVDTWEWSVGALAEETSYSVATPEITLQAPGNYTCQVSAENAAGRSRLYFTVVVREAWTTWEVSAVTPGFENVVATSLALEDGNGELPHIAVAGPGSVVYCRPLDGDWWEIPVAVSLDAEFIFSNTALAVDPSGHHYLVYGDYYSNVICNWDDGFDWRWDTLDENDLPGYVRRFLGPRVFLDSNDLPHVCYEMTETADDWNADFIRYQYSDGDIWYTSDSVATSGGLMTFGTIEPMTPLALDSADIPHIAYYDDNLGDILLAERDPNWSDEVVNHGQATGMISLDIDSNDSTHIAYLVSSQIYYASHNGTGWDIIAVPSGLNAGDWISLKLDSSDEPHIAYQNTVNKDLHMVYHDGPDWYNVRIDALGDTGFGCSLAIDNDDLAHVSYHDWSSEWVKIASEPAV